MISSGKTCVTQIALGFGSLLIGSKNDGLCDWLSSAQEVLSQSEPGKLLSVTIE